MSNASEFGAFHVAEVDLLRYFDGEMKPREHDKVKQHVLSCWECRSRLLSVERAQDELVRFHRRVQATENLVPPTSFAEFKQSLHKESRSADSEGNRSLGRRSARASLERFVQGIARVFELPQVRQLATACIVLALASAAMWWGTRADRQTQQASEKLRTAATAEQRTFASIPHPVVYQKVEVRVAGKRIQRSIYRDTVKNRHVAKLENIADQEDAQRALRPVEAAYTQARLDWQAPLSPGRWATWRASLTTKNDSIHDDRGITEIRTSTTEGPIIEAELRLRDSDLHPISSALRMQDGETVEIAELDYRVFEFSQVPNGIFGPAGPLPSVFPRSIAARVSPPVDEFELRVDVLARLDAVSAFVGDQLSVSPTPNGMVRIEGIVASDEREKEILKALGPLARSPRVNLQIKSATEFEATDRKPSKPLQVESVEVPVTASAQNPYVRAYLTGEKGSQGIQAEVQRFSVRAFDHSIQAQLHALALKQVVNGASPDKLAKANPKAVQQWRTLVTRHARAIQQEIAALREQLAPIFPAAPKESSISAEEVNTEDLYGAAAKLCEMASGTDRALWTALSSATEGTADLSKNVRYWESLRNQELLAAAIEQKANRRDKN